MGAESNGKLPHLFIPSKTATFVPKLAVEDLPLGRTTSLEPAFGVKDLVLGRTLRWLYIWAILQRLLHMDDMLDFLSNKTGQLLCFYLCRYCWAKIKADIIVQGMLWTHILYKLSIECSLYVMTRSLILQRNRNGWENTHYITYNEHSFLLTYRF